MVTMSYKEVRTMLGNGNKSTVSTSQLLKLWLLSTNVAAELNMKVMKRPAIVKDFFI